MVGRMMCMLAAWIGYVCGRYAIRALEHFRAAVELGLEDAEKQQRRRIQPDELFAGAASRKTDLGAHAGLTSRQQAETVGEDVHCGREVFAETQPVFWLPTVSERAWQVQMTGQGEIDLMPALPVHQLTDASLVTHRCSDGSAAAREAANSASVAIPAAVGLGGAAKASGALVSEVSARAA
jgi:hypothetical protein